MNNDYLWDRTGEPDPEIQQLEQVLGTLRYQPRPLELPAQVRIGHPRTFFSRIAIAATVATMLVSGASWLLLRRQNASVGLGSASNLPAVKKLKTAPENAAAPARDEVVAESKVTNGVLENKPKRRGVRKSLLAGNKQFRTLRARGTELTARDRGEAQAAKEQLMLGLRVASTKLSLAQKRAQGAYPGSLIRNQHKVG
ncbi:MAG: hypothetical protein H0T64_11965 [Pyrinomonadaceae bacterium]|nr:hypothetical protein [Pyrinomonadaceae bacterium]